MKSKMSRQAFATTISVLGVFCAVAGSPAHAQYGMGGGMGWGAWGGFTQVPQPGTFINSLALVAAARPSTAPNGHPYAGDSNSYINHVRDNGFVERYSVDRSQVPSYVYRTSANSSGGHGNTTVAASPRPKPVLPLASFYGPDNSLAWPSDAPVDGELGKKRSSFDDVSKVVLAETKAHGVASLAAVTDARQKLVAYGQPALRYVRSRETPRLADTFHLFLLSLYESLEQAATVASAPAS
jgi:hypothetical protein